MIILGIETSCDETAAAVVEKTAAGFAVRSNVVASQIKIHARYGGVVPEVAARNHVGKIIPVIDQALKAARVRPQQLDRLAVTVGPGLITSLLVGVETAKTLAFIWKKPLVPVNHMRAHVYGAWLPSRELPSPGPRRTTLSHRGERGNRVIGIPNPPSPQRWGGIEGGGVGPTRFPLVALVVSGGHTELVLMNHARRFRLLGQTLDDAAGEAFDKVGKLLGLPFPGGPAVAKLAERGNPAAIPFPRAMIASGDFNFSFSGLKTAVLYYLRQRNPPTPPLSKGGEKNSPPYAGGARGRKEGLAALRTADVAASFQEAVVDSLVPKTITAARRYQTKTVILAGGVAANLRLRDQLSAAVSALGVSFRVPDYAFCTDNAAMIAAAGYFGKPKDWRKIYVDANLPITSPS